MPDPALEEKLRAATSRVERVDAKMEAAHEATQANPIWAAVVAAVEPAAITFTAFVRSVKPETWQALGQILAGMIGAWAVEKASRPGGGER